MTINRKLDYVILDLIESSQRTIRTAPLNLGAIPGTGGGEGAPPGGFVGWLPQTRVAYDTDEFESLYTPASGQSLLDNLNHIRYRIGVLESGGSITVVDSNSGITYWDTTEIHFSGPGVIVSELNSGVVLVTINATGSGGGIEEAPIDGYAYARQNAGWVIASGSTSLTVQESDGSPTVANVDKIIFSGAAVTDLGSGDVLVVFSGGAGAALTVQEADGSPTVTNVDKIIFSGAAVTDMGSGDALVTILGLMGSNGFYIDQTGGTSDTYGTISGVVNGITTDFIVSQSGYISASLSVYLNGQLQTQGTAEDWIELYPPSGTFRFNTAPLSGDSITVAYQKSQSVSGNADTLDGYHASSYMLKVTLGGKYYLPFGVFSDVAPFTAVTKLPYAATIDRAMTLIQWVQGCRVAGTSDATNYWTIDLKREYNGTATIIATIDTKTVNSTDWKNITTNLSSYAINPASNATIIYVQVTTKTGAPGNLYLAGPALEISI